MRWSAFAFLLLAAAPAWAQATNAPTAMTPSPDDRARQWLTLLDDQNYADAYTQMAATARGKVSEGAWSKDIAARRTPLGAMSNRALKDIKLGKLRAGMRDGQTAAVRYDVTFAHNAAATESIGLVSEHGSWAVMSYAVK
ncbi:MAG TPA: DUF4019 domain-containing protein [Rhizomicrobium sp.]|jgi:hypothetical protein